MAVLCTAVAREGRERSALAGFVLPSVPLVQAGFCAMCWVVCPAGAVMDDYSKGGCSDELLHDKQLDDNRMDG